MEISHSKLPAAQVGFKGYQHKKSSEGLPLYKFNFPYDSKHWDCYVEFFRVKRNDSDYSYSIDKKNGFKPYFTKQLTPNGVDVDIENELKLKDSEPVAYRYRLSRSESAKVEDKKKNITYQDRYAKDDDASVCGDGCNLITRKGTSVIAQGPMILAMPDTFNPGYVFAGFKSDKTGEVIKDPNAKDLSHFTRTFSNKVGGKTAGIIAMIPELRSKGYKSIIPTPLTGGDNVSGHLYWIKRANQTDNIDEYDTLQRELFKNGMNLISDSAYTSQGLEGVNFQYAVRHIHRSDKPQEYYRFRMQGALDAPLGLGIVPKNMDNLRHKIINSPDEYKQLPNGQIKIIENGNKDYDPTQPSFVQVYDDSLVTDIQRNDKKNLIRDYAKTNATITDPITGEEVVNSLAINTHDDTLVSNAFKINPTEYRANIKNLNAINKNKAGNDKINLNSPMGTLVVCKFSGIEIRPKDEGGFVTWDANTDMAKLSYTESDYDTQMLESIKNPKQRTIEEKKLARAHAANRDALTDTMRYWTKHVRNVHTEYTAKTLGKLEGSSDEILDRINSLIYNRNNQKLPDDLAIDAETAENIYYGDYKLRNKDVNYNKALDKALMADPIDRIELADDTVGVLSSPYISKYSPDYYHIGESRYDAMNDSTFIVPEEYANTYNEMNKVYTNQIHKFATKVLHLVDKQSDEKLFQNDGSKLTEYGQYVVPLVAGDIAKYAIIKSLVPGAETKILKDGTLTYDYEKLKKEATLERIGINGDSPEDEANQVVHKIKNGVENLTTGDVSIVARSINSRIKNTDAMSFRFAEAMVGKSGLGLGHRIDAGKDVADMDAIRNLDDSADNQLSDVIDIWKTPLAAVKEENPASPIMFEFTDLWDMLRATYTKDAVNGNQGNVSGINPDARFKNANDIATKILTETGATTEANYDFFFTAGLDTFGKDFKGYDADVHNDSESARVALLPDALNRFADRPLEYKRNSYTFGGNHDKPRMAECFGMDMEMFHADLNKRSTEKEINHRKTAYMILNDKMQESDLSDDDKNIIYNSIDYFNNVSSKAIAKADWIRSGIGIANNIIRNERLANAKNDNERNMINEEANATYAAYSKALVDIVKGNYYLNGDNDNDNKKVADSYKKQLEKDGFGAIDLLTAYDITTKQAEAKHGLKNVSYLNDAKQRKNFNDLFEYTALGVPMKKVRMYTQMIGAISGNPTVYAGDEFGMTGYEEKNHNVYLFNRGRIPREVVEGDEKTNPQYKKFIADHKNAIEGIINTRHDNIDNKMGALNNGTMYKLDDLYCESADPKRPGKGLRCPIILSQESNGSMNVSVFNYNGISLDDPYNGRTINTRNDLDNIIDEKVIPVKFDKIMLRSTKTGEKIEIRDGLKFYNIESSDPSYYESKHDENGDCYLERVIDSDDKNIDKSGDTAPEGVLRLYYQPEEVKKSIAEKRELEKKYTTSFKGLNKRIYFNPRYDIAVSNPYSAPKKAETGSNLSIMSVSK